MARWLGLQFCCYTPLLLKCSRYRYPYFSKHSDGFTPIFKQEVEFTEKDWKSDLIHICIWENPWTCHLYCAFNLGPAIIWRRMTDWQQKATCHSEKWKLLWIIPRRPSWTMSRTALSVWVGEKKEFNKEVKCARTRSLGALVFLFSWKSRMFERWELQ